MRRHLSFANVVATLALVFAMSGGAYAAKHYLITSTKQIKPSVLAALHGGFGIELSAKGEDPSAVTGTFAVTAANATIGRESVDSGSRTGGRP